MTDTQPTAKNTLTLAELARLHAPVGAKAAIVAEYEEDKSDIQTDYFNVVGTRTVLIGWRTGGREDFRQLRAAAGRFPETEQLGPGCDRWSARVVQASESFASNGRMYHAGDPAHGHESECPPFTGRTEDEVRAYTDAMGEPYRVIFRGEDGAEIVATYRWQIARESIEHRDNYSMGRGNYLKASSSSYSTGWAVRSRSLDYCGTEIIPEVAACALEKPAAAPATPEVLPNAGWAAVRLNAEKNGVEIRFPIRPPESFIASLKEARFRWSRFSRCWYARQTTEQIEAAWKIAERYNGQTPETKEKALERIEETFTPEQDAGNEAPGTI